MAFILFKTGDLLEIQLFEVSEMETPWLTVEAAAQYLNKSERTLLQWMRAGKIKAEDLKNLASSS